MPGPFADEVSRFARVLEAIGDPDLRARRARELLSALPARDAVARIAALLRGAGMSGAARASAIEAVLRALHSGVGLQPWAALRDAAAALGEDEVSALLSNAPAQRAFDHGARGYVDREMAARTLGLRRQLARSLDRDVLNRLMHDQDPTVLQHLLENPRVTERDVLLAAARRPTQPAALEEIFRSRRWAQNRRVRKALALNPYCPPALAAAALSLLTRPELREVAADAHVDGGVRAQARRLLARRAGTKP